MSPKRTTQQRERDEARVLFAVVCEDFRTESYTSEEAALRRLAAIEACGACRLEHRVVRLTARGGKIRRDSRWAEVDPRLDLYRDLRSGT